MWESYRKHNKQAQILHNFHFCITNNLQSIGKRETSIKPILLKIYYNTRKKQISSVKLKQIGFNANAKEHRKFDTNN